VSFSVDLKDLDSSEEEGGGPPSKGGRAGAAGAGSSGGTHKPLRTFVTKSTERVREKLRGAATDEFGNAIKE
jgi:hypothetical protein